MVIHRNVNDVSGHKRVFEDSSRSAKYQENKTISFGDGDSKQFQHFGTRSRVDFEVF